MVWSAADIEVWLKSGRKNSRQREIVVDSYEVTIFPAESVNNTHTVPAVSAGATPIGEFKKLWSTAAEVKLACLQLRQFIFGYC